MKPIPNIIFQTSQMVQSLNFQGYVHKTYLEMQILSFHSDNYEALKDDAILKDIAHKFIQKHAPLALTTAVVHRKPQQKKVHIHLAISRNNYKDSSSNRVSKKTFQETKQYIEQYQQDRYPHLKASEITHTPTGKAQVKDSEYKMKQKRHVCSVKLDILEKLNISYLEASSREDFYSKITKNGIELYTYRDKVVGLVTPEGLKIRMHRLGFSKKRLLLLD